MSTLGSRIAIWTSPCGAARSVPDASRLSRLRAHAPRDRGYAPGPGAGRGHLFRILVGVHIARLPRPCRVVVVVALLILVPAAAPEKRASAPWDPAQGAP